MAAEIGCDQVVLEVDSQTLQRFLSEGLGRQSAVGGLCFDITELGKSFRGFEVRWVCREANSVADHCTSLVLETERAFF